MKVFGGGIAVCLTATLLFFLALDVIAQTLPFNLKVTPISEKVIAGPLVLSNQGSFFVGGRDIESHTPQLYLHMHSLAQSLSIKYTFAIKYQPKLRAIRLC